ncbi:AMP-binding protein [Streptomyces beigongshangae]|uniref:AMP-binding protein n=1 Tax=Streptomyces beigongshangae TaxID=2841597 RepID=UPI001C84FBBA|nr:AMP-binding protein [Streptomyces sp. REN17]
MSIEWPNLKPTLSGARRSLDGIQGVYERITDIAVRHSAGLAVVHGDIEVTYEELMGRVLELQHRFESLDLPPKSAIVVQLPRGIEYIVAVLATLAHDCHFVPVAEGEPEARVAEIVGRVHAVARVRLSPSGQSAVSRLSEAGPLQREASGLAYILHTSGSTGRPKGAALSMTALTSLLSWYGEQLSLTPDARFAQLSRPSFDFSIPEIFLPLLHGARMIIPPRPIDSGLIQVTEYLIEQGVTTLQFVPTLLRPFVNLLDAVPPMADQLKSISTIVCNGEALPDPLRQHVARVLPTATLVNSYGPTEACVAVTWHRCSKQQEILPNIIGTPMPNVDLYVMSADLEPVPTGTIGELWIAGAQVADGYIGAPAETQRSFYVRPGDGGKQPADHVYRTGDLVRALDDGNLEFIGRRDRQVQLRGIRVEIGEIEAAVKGTGLCDECRVTAVPGPADSTANALECFVTPATVDTDELERQVQSRLPKDRWPRRFHALASLPATTNGKVNEAALLALAQRSGPGAEPAAVAHDQGTREAHHTPTAESAEDVLKGTLAGLIGRLPSADETLGSLGLDSLGRLELQVATADRGYVLPAELCSMASAAVGEVAAAMSRTERMPGAPGTVGRTGADLVALRDELRQVFDQACEGDTEFLVVQSSLPDFKNVSPHDVLSMLLSEIDRVSQRITVALPAYTFSYICTRTVDLTSDPSESGMASTHVMKAIGGRRTRHPVYSFVVVGPEAQAMADIDWTKRSTFGDDSVFGWFSARNTKYILLGTHAYAQVHRSEHLAEVPYMSHVYMEGTITDDTGTKQGGAYVYARDVPESRDAQVFGVNTDSILCLGGHAVSRRNLGMCEATVIDVRTFEEIAIPALRSNPYALLQPELLAPAQALVKERATKEEV